MADSRMNGNKGGPRGLFLASHAGTTQEGGSWAGPEGATELKEVMQGLVSPCPGGPGWPVQACP